MVFVHKGCTAGVSAAVTVVGSGGSGGSKTFNGGGSGGQMHPASLEKLEAENARLREALKKIGEGDTCISLMTHPPICKRAYDARAALKEKE
jgi:hypothetical protein